MVSARDHRCAALAAGLRGASVLVLACAATTAGAFEIPLDSADFSLRLDNTIGYNLGIRTESPDAAFYRNPRYTESDLEYKKFDINIARLDFSSAFEVDYQGWAGFRMSGAGWIDTAFSDHLNSVPPEGPTLVLPNFLNQYTTLTTHKTLTVQYADASHYTHQGQYNDYAQRWNGGPSGELRDVFAWVNFTLWNAPVNVKVGQYGQYWGESLFDYIDGVSYAQSPIDIERGLRAPGTLAKDLVLPVPQFTATTQISPALSFALQYYFGWGAARVPAAGSYFGTPYPIAGTDAQLYTGVAELTDLNSNGVPIMVPYTGYEKPHNDGNWGVYLKYRPHWLWGATAGFYYRRFDETLPWVLEQSTTPPVDNTVIYQALSGLSAYKGYSAVYNRGVQLIGLSFEKNWRKIVFGGEVVMRQGTALLTPVVPAPNAASFNQFTTPTVAPDDLAQGRGAVGDTLHAIVNASGTVGKTYFWDAIDWKAEISWSHLQKVTKNAELFAGEGYGGCMVGKLGGDPTTDLATPGTKSDGCATGSAVGVRVSFAPSWNDVRPALDLSFPISFGVGVMGNSAVLGGSSAGAGSYSIGTALDYRHRYKVGLAYNDYLSRYNTANGVVTTSSTNGNGLYNDRGWVSLTFSTGF